MVAKKKTTKKTTRAKPKTKVVYRTRTVYKEQPSPMGNVVKDVTPMIGMGMGALIGIGVAKGIGNALSK